MKDKLQMLAYNIGAVLIGLVISGCMLLFMKVDPLAVCAEALGKIFSDRYTLGEILVKASPLIFTSLAFAFTYKANLFNIGAQGQFYAGSIAAITVSLSQCAEQQRRAHHDRSGQKIYHSSPLPF